MTPEKYTELIDALWKANNKHSEKIARDLLAQHPLPPAAHILFANLTKLLASLQKTSFYYGALSALYAVEEASKSPDDNVH